MGPISLNSQGLTIFDDLDDFLGITFHSWIDDFAFLLFTRWMGFAKLSTIDVSNPHFHRAHTVFIFCMQYTTLYAIDYIPYQYTM